MPETGRWVLKIEITKAQLEAIKNLTDDVDGMIGAAPGENDELWSKYVKLIDRMLAKNGISRQWKQGVTNEKANR